MKKETNSQMKINAKKLWNLNESKRKLMKFFNERAKIRDEKQHKYESEKK